MTTMKRAPAIVALLMLAACSREENVGELQQFAMTSGSHSHSDPSKPTRYTRTIELTLPEGFHLEGNDRLTMVDVTGRRFQPSHWGRTGNGGGEKVNGTFDVPDLDTKIATLYIGKLEIDLQTHQVIRRLAPP